jgi:FixJ family two-component response regulator
MSIWRSLFQCCSFNDTSQTHELNLVDADLACLTKRQTATSALGTELTNQLVVSELDVKTTGTERHRSSLHEIMQHMCSESATSYGDSLLSFKKAMQEQAALQQ